MLRVLSGIHLLIPVGLQESVVPRRHQCTDGWTEPGHHQQNVPRQQQRQTTSDSPVQIVIAREIPGGDAGAKRPGRIQRPARVVDAAQLCDEESQPDPDRREGRRLMLLRGQHQDDEDQQCSPEGLDEDALRDRGPSGQGNNDGEGPGEHAGHQGGGNDATKDLGGQEKEPSDPGDVAREAEGQGNLVRDVSHYR